MNGAEHYLEAERLTALAMDSFTDPEGGYDDSDGDPSAKELATRAYVHTEARGDASVYLAAAQIHATLALAAATALNSTHHYVGDSREITEWARIAQPDAMATKPCPDGCRDIHGDGCLPRCIDLRNARDAQAAKPAPIDEEPPF
ncbi:hypothetical protein Cme02nite_38590 [Catellatospora methionotrophica]|uniref:Uncharacterized protein n=1 Tax=Catellatospora methionotrophica TaxID=121620 RepID=A0A8J3PFS6_9ACTN|nr:hypothetical protein [Catellatospora methionotrophica]GIG15527.1 hypothetical protein Cme02nite_38590 [Catellatospora methionotrophica]